MHLFYQRCLEAWQKFNDLSFGKPGNLEARMVDSGLYCMMTWCEQPEFVRTVVANAVPRHEYWNVSLEHFIELPNAAFDVVAQAMDEGDDAMKNVIAAVRDDLLDAIVAASKSAGLSIEGRGGST